MSRLIKGTLPIGVEVDGVVHRAFTMRASTVLDNIDVTEEMEENDEAPTPLRLGTAMMARQLVTLGTLTTFDGLRSAGQKNPQPQVHTALVRGMHIADWNHLDKLSEDQEKKLLCDGPTPSQAGGSTPAPGPCDTASSPTS